MFCPQNNYILHTKAKSCLDHPDNEFESSQVKFLVARMIEHVDLC